MEDFSSGDYLFLTHLGDYTESIIDEEEVEELITAFPGEVFLVNEFPRENEDFEKEIFGEYIVPDENLLQTRVGLGEPEELPECPPETAYFGGFTLTWCMSITAGNVVEQYGEDTEYAILADYTVDTLETTLEESIEGIDNIETVTDLEEQGYVKKGDIENYPEDCRVISSCL